MVVFLLFSAAVFISACGNSTSGDPSYITSHNNARNLILKMDRDELLEEILVNYLGIN